jgi:hypothetical protein
LYELQRLRNAGQPVGGKHVGLLGSKKKGKVVRYELKVWEHFEKTKL